MNLLVVDQVATACGVRQDPAGGMTAWCTLDLPSQQADMAGSGRQLPASQPPSVAVDVDGTGREPAEAVGSPGPELVWSKLRPPALRAGLIPRAGLVSLLQTGLAAKLCLLDASARDGRNCEDDWAVPAGRARIRAQSQKSTCG